MTEMEEDGISWLRTPFKAPVLDAAGTQIGTTESLLGDEQEDVFHGIVVKLTHGGEHKEIPASQVTRITASHVETSTPVGGASALQPYSEQRWFHLGWGGLFRKRPEWREGE